MHAAGPHGAHLDYSRRIQFRPPVARPDRESALRQHVVCIVTLGAEEEVGGVDASWIVAPMADVHTIRDLPMMNDPGCSVGL